MSISAQASANIIVWGRSIGIPNERITDILTRSSDAGAAWTVDASPSTDAALYAALVPHFVARGLYNEHASRFVAAMNAIGPAAQLLNVA